MEVPYAPAGTRPGAERMMLIAALSAVPRFLLTARATDAVSLIAAQALHGTSFAWFWLGAVQWVSVQASHAEAEAGIAAHDGARGNSIATSAQSLLATASYGLGALVGALGAGELARTHGTVRVFEGLGLVAIAASLSAAGVLRASAGRTR